MQLCVRAVWHDLVLSPCIRGIERDPCLGEWVGLGRGAHVDLASVGGDGVGGGRERKSYLRKKNASYIWLAMSEGSGLTRAKLR